MARLLPLRQAGLSVSALLERELAAVIFQLGRLNDPSGSNPHRVQLAVQLGLPEAQEGVEHRKFRAQVVFLPEIGLEKSWVVRPAVDDLRRGQTVPLRCQFKSV